MENMTTTLYAATVHPVLDEDPTDFRVYFAPTYEDAVAFVRGDYIRHQRHFEPELCDRATKRLTMPNGIHLTIVMLQF